MSLSSVGPKHRHFTLYRRRTFGRFWTNTKTGQQVGLKRLPAGPYTYGSITTTFLAVPSQITRLNVALGLVQPACRERPGF